MTFDKFTYDRKYRYGPISRWKFIVRTFGYCSDSSQLTVDYAIDQLTLQTSVNYVNFVNFDIVDSIID